MQDTWCIYHVKNCSHVRPFPKNKFTAIVCKDKKCMGFLINSIVRPFILKRPDLLRCQVKIKASDYKFLDHDSYIDCVELYPFEDTDLIDKKDTINMITKAEIKRAVKGSDTIVTRYQKLILSNR
jgi:hypothetical protein